MTNLRPQISPGWPLRNTGADLFKAGDRVTWLEPVVGSTQGRGPHSGTVRDWPTRNTHRYVAVMLDSHIGPWFTGGKKLILALPQELERLA